MGDFLRACWISPTRSNADDPEILEPGKTWTPDGLIDYVAELNRLADKAPTALYSTGQGGDLMRKLAPQRARLDGPTFAIPPGWLLLTEFDSLRASLAFDETALRLFDDAPASVHAQLPARAVYREVIAVPGPEDDGGYTFPPAIQFGRFSAPTPDDEWALTRWHNDKRMADFTTMPGGIRARRFATVCGGFSKAAVLYAFTSLEDRLEVFENVLEAKAHDTQVPTPAHQTVHEPYSSCVGMLLTTP